MIFQLGGYELARIKLYNIGFFTRSGLKLEGASLSLDLHIILLFVYFIRHHHHICRLAAYLSVFYY